MTIPRELRDSIYEHAAIDVGSVCIKSNAKRHHDERVLASKSALILVSKQVHDEYLEGLTTTALSGKNSAKINAVITDFHFSAVTTFIDALTTVQRVLLKENHKLHITFVFSTPVRMQWFEPKLRGWLSYCWEDDVRAEYAVDDDASASGSVGSLAHEYAAGEAERVGKVLSDWASSRRSSWTRGARSSIWCGPVWDP